MDQVLWLFTLGYLFQSLANGILIYTISKQKSIYGLSVDSQWLFLFATLARCIWIFDTRLTSLPLASFELVINVLLGVICCYLSTKYSHTSIFQTPKYLSAYAITGACAVLCFLFHPGEKNQYFLTVQMLVSFTMFMECAGLLPQFVMMRKSKEVEIKTGHYLMCLAVARVFRLIFWVQLYMDGYTFGYLIIADLIHTILLSDFAIFYIKSMRSGKSILLPS
ncbi:unnamed protein product [Blepharisma stoltei]|uniref:ER lumen protein-retaining receptor n=1 Tax=Blepharisma stoltei TaxID=1481888 RepID=A0AAU9J425_9CILI|nr:unnamed protein product [Blepharisma stoltei]